MDKVYVLISVINDGDIGDEIVIHGVFNSTQLAEQKKGKIQALIDKQEYPDFYLDICEYTLNKFDDDSLRPFYKGVYNMKSSKKLYALLFNETIDTMDDETIDDEYTDDYDCFLNDIDNEFQNIPCVIGIYDDINLARKEMHRLIKKYELCYDVYDMRDYNFRIFECDLNKLKLSNTIGYKDEQ